MLARSYTRDKFEECVGGLLEKRIEAGMRRKVTAMGGLCLKFVSPGCAGVPDRVLLLPGGRVIFVELKTDTGRLSPVQVRVIQRMQKLGIDVRVVYGKEDADKLMEEINGVQAT